MPETCSKCRVKREKFYRLTKPQPVAYTWTKLSLYKVCLFAWPAYGGQWNVSLHQDSMLKINSSFEIEDLRSGFIVRSYYEYFTLQGRFETDVGAPPNTPLDFVTLPKV